MTWASWLLRFHCFLDFLCKSLNIKVTTVPDNWWNSFLGFEKFPRRQGTAGPPSNLSCAIGIDPPGSSDTSECCQIRWCWAPLGGKGNGVRTQWVSAWERVTIVWMMTSQRFSVSTAHLLKTVLTPPAEWSGDGTRQYAEVLHEYFLDLSTSPCTGNKGNLVFLWRCLEICLKSRKDENKHLKK